MLSVFRELWQHRDLALVLGWRELVIRYKRSVLGVAWALAEPLVLVAVYVVVFGIVLDAGRTLPNYALFALMGTLAWTFLSSTLEQCTHTVLQHAPLIKKAYFPREILLIAVVFSRLTTLLAGLAVAILAMFATAKLGSPVEWSRVWTLPLGAAALTALTLGLGMLMSSLQVMLRDVGFLVRFAVRIAFYACPVVYPVMLVPERMRLAYELNPMVCLLWLFQAPTNQGLAAPSSLAVSSMLVALVLLPAGGWLAFRKLQWQVADLL